MEELMGGPKTKNFRVLFPPRYNGFLRARQEEAARSIFFLASRSAILKFIRGVGLVFAFALKLEKLIRRSLGNCISSRLRPYLNSGFNSAKRLYYTTASSLLNIVHRYRDTGRNRKFARGFLSAAGKFSHGGFRDQEARRRAGIK